MIATFVAFSMILIAKPVPVSIVQGSNGYELRRGGVRYDVHGAGAKDDLDSLVAAGGNSIRIWGVDDKTRDFLDVCDRKGITVLVGFWLMKAGDGGFSYLDKGKVQKQFDDVEKRVKELKDHPAVLGWTVGNEVELGLPKDQEAAMWGHVEQLAQMIRKEDVNHPVGAVVADMWPDKMSAILKYAPSLQFLGVNSYGGLLTVHERMELWKKPYMITEFGPNVPDEGRNTNFGLPVEPNSTAKGEIYREGYAKAIAGQKGKVIGSYVFYWDHASVGIASWFNLHLRSGEKLAGADVMHELWTGKPAVNPVPKFVSAEKLGDFSWRVKFEQPGGGDLSRKLYLVAESSGRFQGDFEMEQGFAFEGLVGEVVEVPGSVKPGVYRAYVVARNSKNGAAVWNTVFKK
jgi:hypothetical protein